MQVALGEAGNCGAGVAVEHAAGAMPVEQLAHQAVTRGRRFIAALVQRGEQWGGAVTEPAGDGVAVGAAAGVAAQSGDLLESKLKRISSVKDAGSIIPGHGGIMDRLDSIVVSIPTVYYLVGAVFKP